MMTTVHTQARRAFMKNMALAAVATSLPAINFAQSAATTNYTFAPQAGTWRSFEVTTRVDILKPEGVTRLWLPVPNVDTDWQKSLDNVFSSNGKTQMISSEDRYGARMLYAEFAENEAQPFVELTSHVQTQNRSVDWSQPQAAKEGSDTLALWTQATDLLPTDGIVRETALQAVQGARTDVEKAQRLYDWVVINTFREPKVQGCGEGDIQTMLETGNLSGKCADLNALFVGLCRSVGLPARDVYGVRLAPSAFGYKQLGGNPASLEGAQHCRAEVYLNDHGWVAMDPADVTKVMRQETPEWIKSPTNALIAPVNKALFGAWEGNWMAYNMAHDVTLPNATGPALGFLMYPAGETDAGRLDSYAPDDFKYRISAREITL